jgi:hypothetical protein
MWGKEVIMAWKFLSAALTITTIVLLAGCGGSTTPPVTYTPTELKYQLIDNFGEPFYCNPYEYPVARPGQEEQDAIAQFPIIMSKPEEFTAITEHLGIAGTTNFTTEEKVLIFREYLKLNNAITLTPADDIDDFSLRVGENQGESIQGTITSGGVINVTKRESSFNTCPICLAAGTLIDTPDGAVPVEQLRVGMPVWTVDGEGQRVAATIIDTASTWVPDSFKLVKIYLDDGRTLTASPGHPAADGRAIGGFNAGDVLDGSVVVSAELVTYSKGATYDILPAGPTGLYWANGILLGSTISR